MRWLRRECGRRRNPGRRRITGILSGDMLENDHYIPNAQNAHIDTSDFEAPVRVLLSNASTNIERAFEAVREEVLSRLNVPPEVPADDALICRYVSLPKFLQFVHTREIHFASVARFNDRWESRIPEDYDLAVLGICSDLDVPSESWSWRVKRRAAHWRVSCWTRLGAYFDDNLMWSAYAGGPEGVGVTIPFGVLRDSFAMSVPLLSGSGPLHSGCVSYESLLLPAFHKHSMFRNEKEVRFAFETNCSSDPCISVDDVFGSFGVRLSPAATLEQHDIVRRLWLGYGGLIGFNGHCSADEKWLVYTESPR